MSQRLQIVLPDPVLSNGELAKVLGVSESNAGTMLHRAIEKLRKACNETA